MNRDDNGQMFLEHMEEEYTFAFGSFNDDFNKYVKDNQNERLQKTERSTNQAAKNRA